MLFSYNILKVTISANVKKNCNKKFKVQPYDIVSFSAVGEHKNISYKVLIFK